MLTTIYARDTHTYTAYEALQGHDGFILMSSKKNKNFTLARTGSGMDALRAELSDEIMYGIFREAGRELVFTFIPLTVSGVKRGESRQHCRFIVSYVSRNRTERNCVSFCFT